MKKNKEIRLLKERIKELEKSRVEGKQMEEALQGLQAQLQDLYEKAPVAYFSVDIDGNIIRCNQRAEELTGYTKEELVGRQVLELYADTPQGKELAAKVLKRFRADKRTTDEELQMQKEDGTTMWVSLSVNAVLDAKEQVVESRSVVLDITKRKLAEIKLRESEEQLKKAQSIAHLGSWEFVIRPIRNTKWSDEMYNIFEIPKTETKLYMALINRIHPEDRAWVKKKMVKFIKKKENHSYEFRILTPKGEEKVIYTQTSCISTKMEKHVKFLGTAQDITERKQAEEKLQRLKCELEIRVTEKTKELQERLLELERFYDAAVDRELRMEELRKRIKELEKELGI